MKIFKENYRLITGMGLILSVLFAREPISRDIRAKTTQSLESSYPRISLLNINNMAYWVDKSSGGTIMGSPNDAQVDYPIGTGQLIYKDGILWGAKVSDGGAQRVRVGGCTYYDGTKAGKVVYDAAGNVIGSEDPSTRHVWRVRTDYKSTDLTGDAASYYATSVSDVTPTQVQQVHDNYDYDWNNWPADEGAPYKEINGTAGYQPATWDTTLKSWVEGDIPGYPGADQTLWTAANDIPLIVNANGDSLGYNDTAPPLYGAQAIGMEIQLTMWAYNFGPSEPLGNVTFKRARLIYTGLPGGPSDAVLDTVYITQWSDPDLGTYTDDYVGSDVDLSLGYVYNGNTTDGTFYGIHGIPVPAGGYDFLQGPITADGDTLGMTSFTYFGAGSSIDDPDLDDYNGSLQFFNLMEGYMPRPEWPQQVPWTDLTTGETTNFVLAGDPVAGTGWIDGVQLPPGDRRMVMASGPFTMALGDTQDVVLALVGGHGQDNKSSVTVVKFHDKFAQYAYDNNFDLPSPPPAPKVKATEMDKEIILDWGFDYDAVAATEEAVSKGFRFEGYNVYQLPSASSPLSEGEKVATYDLINLLTTIFDQGIDPSSGFVLKQVKQSGTDSGIQRFFSTDYDELRNRPMSNGITYHFAVTAYNFLEESEGSPFVTLESSPVIVSVTPHSPDPGVTWGNEHAEEVATTHSGTAGGTVEVTVVNPEDLTGDDYEVLFDQQHYYRDLNGIWQMTNYPDSVGKSLGKILDVSPSTITGSAIASASVGTIDLIFTLDLVAPGGAWVDGVMIDLPDDLTINNWEASGALCSYPEYGQNCVNMDGTLETTTNAITWGDSARSGFGAIEGTVIFTINVNAFTFPITAGFEVYDDGYDGTIIDADGTISITELGYEFRTIKHWNLRNVSTGEILLEDQVVMAGVALESIVDGVYIPEGTQYGVEAIPITEGFQVNVSVGYAAPVNYESITPTGSGTYDWDSYPDNGWATTALASETFFDNDGNGASSVDLLQRDIQIRWTGEYDDPITVGNLTVHPIKEGTGSMATIDGARLYDIADHPLNPNPGSNDPFVVRIPFEVWDMEAEGGPQQIDITIYDRRQDVAVGGDFYAFNPNDRMYLHIINRPYNENVADLYGADASYITWNLISWEADFVVGDVIDIVYANPIQQGVDTWTFSTTAKVTDGAVTQADIDLINVFPNPYYGYHEQETSRASKYVSFNHLPQKATIRVFNLGGVMVKEIKKDDPTQFARWDLRNQYGYPVASGMYIIHIELPDLGMEKMLKLGLVQESQVLKYY